MKHLSVKTQVVSDLFALFPKVCTLLTVALLPRPTTLLCSRDYLTPARCGAAGLLGLSDDPSSYHLRSIHTPPLSLVGSQWGQGWFL